MNATTFGRRNGTIIEIIRAIIENARTNPLIILIALTFDLHAKHDQTNEAIESPNPGTNVINPIPVSMYTKNKIIPAAGLLSCIS